MIEPDINERMRRFAPSQQEPDVDPVAAEIAAQAMIPSAQPTMQALPEIDPVAREIAERSRENLNAAVLGARTVNPDEAARATTLGRRIGVPPEIARADLGRAEQQAYLMDLRAKDFERTDPIMANFLANKEFAEMAHDDLGMLGTVHGMVLDFAYFWNTGSTPGMRRGFERGALTVERGQIGARAMTGFAGPEDFDRAKQVELRLRELTDVGFLGATTEVIAQNLAQLKGIGTGAVAGGAVGSIVPGVGTAVGGALGATAGVMATTAQMEAGNLYLDLREQGVSEETSIQVALAGGYLNGIIEVVGMKVAAKPFQALAKRMIAESVSKAIAQPTVRAALATAGKGYLLQVGSEASEEALQEVVIIAGEEIAKALDSVDTETSMAQAMDRVVDAFTQGAMGAAILGGIGPGANLYVDMRRAAGTQRQQEFFQRLADTSKESRLAKRSPDAYERFLEAQAKGTPAETIYVDGRVAQQLLAQSGLTAQQLEEVLPGMRAQVDEAAQTGGDVTIQTARFGARLANTDLGNALLPHMRLDPDAMSLTEAQEFNARRQETVREAEQILAQKQEADGAFVAEARDIEDTLAAQIVATGQMDEKAARTSAQFMRDFYVTQASALGITPRQVYERFPVRVEGAMPTEAAAAPLEQAAATPQFYSALEREIPVIDAKALTASGWGERFKGLISKGAIKADELEWSGLSDYLKMQEGKVSKDAVLEFLRGNGVRVERVGFNTLSAAVDANAIAREAFFGAMRERYGSLVIDGNQLFDDDIGFGLLSGNIAVNQLPEDLQPLAQRWLAASVATDQEREAEAGYRTKYENYTLPGGTNYREVLLTLPAGFQAPAPAVSPEGLAAREAIFAKYAPKLAELEREGNSLMFAGRALTDEEAQRLADVRNERDELEEQRNAEARAAYKIPERPAAPDFESGHWEQRNVLVHLRMNDRVDADGKRVLFVEEVQSDWGQAGRKKGFRNPALRAQRIAELERIKAEAEKAAEPYTSAGQDAPPNILDTWNAATNELNRIDRDTDLVARAPFVETTDGWLNLGLKQVLLEAVRGNYDRVAFVNGEQSADRYSLSKQVESLSWTGYDSRGATKLVSIYPKQGNPIELPLTDSGVVISTGNQFDGKALDEIVPKEIADQIMGSRNGELAGEQLEVGGEGMTEFYDKIVPIAMNKLLKKYGGGKIGPVEIATGNKWVNLSIRSDGTNYWVESRDGTRMSANADSALKAMELREKLERGIGDQPGFTVTPEMVKKLESGLPLFQAAAAPGPRGGFDPRRLTTILTKTADLSTFLHESAHAFLTFYEQVSQAPDAPARIVSDMDELLRWFGLTGATPAERIAAWNGMSLDQKRKYHEQFAYSFEVYLFDGKAPSVEMQGLFERFSVWLKRVYRSIRDDLNAIYRREFGEDLPILTGEVRQVMDRMLATDDQILRQAAINEMKPMFQSQEQSGMNDAEWAAYQAMQQEAIEAAVTDMNTASLRQMQWLGNARSRVLRDIQRRHDRQRKEVAADVAAAVRVEPVYRAMTYLRTGRFIDADGAEVKVEGPHRLDTKRIKAIYETVPTAASLEAVRATGMPLPAVVQPDLAKLGTGAYGMMGTDGLDPDLVAETFGYSSGDELIRALVAARPIKEEVAARTDAEMLRRYGDLNTPEAVEAEVQAALHNEARARFVAVELRHVARATEPVRVMLDAAKQVARELIAGRRLRDVRPSDFVAAEARAARDASRMGSTPNPVAVGQAAQTRAYNEAIAAGTDPAEAMVTAIEAGAEAARKAQERSDALKAQYGADPQQALIRAKRAQLYQNQLAAEALRVQEEVAKAVKYLRRVLRDENVKRMGAPAADQIAALLERYELAPVSLKRLDERRALAEWLAAQEAAGLVPDIAPEIANEARRINYREVKVSEFRDLVDAVKQIEFIGKNERKLQLAEERAAFEETRDEIVTRIRAVAKVRGLDVDPRSPLTNIGRTAAALRGFAAQHLKAASVARILDGGKDDGPLWNAIIRTANAAADMETTMRAEASAKLAEILGPVFKLGNMGGKGIYFPSIDRALNREARIAIALNVGNDGNRQRLLDGEGWTMEQIQPVLESLTEAEWQAVQKVWDYIDTYRPLIAEKERRLYGKTPEWVEAVPMTVRTADGKTVNLTGGYYPIKYDPVASDRVATIDEVAEAKRAMDGAYTAATTRRSFVKARAKEVVDRPLLYTLDAAFSGVNDVIHDLAWHEWLIGTNRLLRDTEFANAVRETRGPEFLKQLRDWAKDNAAGERKQQVAGEGALSWLRQGISASGLGFNIVSAMMQVTGFNQSIVRVGVKYVGRGIAQFAGSPIDTARMVADKSPFMAERGRTQFRELNEIKNRVRGQTEVARRVTAGTYFLMMNMQRTVDIPTWLGAYQKALDAGKSDAKAVALADQAVRETQGSGLISDLSAIERGGPMMKLFTVFYSYMNTVYNMTAVQTYTARGRGKLAADYVMLLVVPVVLGQAIKNLVQPDADDEEFDPEALARKLAAEELSYLMGTMVIAREFGGAAQLLTGAEGVRMGYGGPAGLRAVGEVYGLATQAGQFEFDRAFRRSAINTLGAFTGLPSAQVNRTIDGIEAVIEGEVTGVGAVVAPITGVQR